MAEWAIIHLHMYIYATSMNCYFMGLYVLGLDTQTGPIFGGRCYISYEENNYNFTGATSTS